MIGNSIPELLRRRVIGVPAWAIPLDLVARLPQSMRDKINAQAVRSIEKMNACEERARRRETPARPRQSISYHEGVRISGIALILGQILDFSDEDGATRFRSFSPDCQFVVGANVPLQTTHEADA